MISHLLVPKLCLGTQFPAKLLAFSFQCAALERNLLDAERLVSVPTRSMGTSYLQVCSKESLGTISDRKSRCRRQPNLTTAHCGSGFFRPYILVYCLCSLFPGAHSQNDGCSAGHNIPTGKYAFLVGFTGL